MTASTSSRTASVREFAATGVVRTARRCLAVIETADPVMFVGVELSQWEGDMRALPMELPSPGPWSSPPSSGRSTWSSWTWRTTRWATGCGGSVRPFYQQGLLKQLNG
ncbi:hypothetical protein SALBM311S_07296 [Streptomyces alboniger]